MPSKRPPAKIQLTAADKVKLGVKAAQNNQSKSRQLADILQDIARPSYSPPDKTVTEPTVEFRYTRVPAYDEAMAKAQELDIPLTELIRREIRK